MFKEKPFKGYIQDWKYVHIQGYRCVYGRPQGHPEFTNWIRTSYVVRTQPCNNGLDTLVETRNSRYILLGRPSDA